MSRWQETFEQHPIHETLRSLENLVTQALKEISEDEATERRRFLKIISLFQEVLDGVDPELISISQLDHLNNVLRQPNHNILNQINAYTQNRNIAHLKTANDNLTNQLPYLSSLLSISKKTKFTKPFRNLEKEFDQFTKNITEINQALQKDIENLQSLVKARETELKKLEQQIETRKKETDALISQWQSQFSEAQERRNVDYESWKKEIKEKTEIEITELIKNVDKELNQHQDNFQQTIDNFIKDAEEKHKAILELYELTAGDSVSAGYINNANQEMEQANTWRWISIGFIITTVGWLGFVYFCNAGVFDFCKFGNNISLWEKIITAFTLTGVLLYGAAFSAQQSTKHRNNEKRARWFALEVKAFDPFISSLDYEQRKELKKQLSERLFGQSQQCGVDSKLIDEHAFKTIIDGLERIITNVLKGVKP